MNLNGSCAEIKNKDFIEKILVWVFPDKFAKIAYQFIKCSLVGAINTAIDMGVFAALVHFTEIFEGPTIKTFITISFSCAVLNSFIWNKYWTFRSKSKNNKELLKQVILFIIIALVGWRIKIYTAGYVINTVGPMFGIGKELWSNLGNVSAIFLTIIWDFVGYKLVVFKK